MALPFNGLPIVTFPLELNILIDEPSAASRMVGSTQCDGALLRRSKSTQFATALQN
jgi:hypothetical protein